MVIRIKEKKSEFIDFKTKRIIIFKCDNINCNKIFERQYKKRELKYKKNYCCSECDINSRWMNNKEQKNKDFKKIVIEVSKNSNTVKEASKKLGLDYKTFRKYAKKYGVFNPNQGFNAKNRNYNKIPLKRILENKHPNYNNSALRIRLIKENIKEAKCERCKLSYWENEIIHFELHHIDGNRYNHKLENLQILCPNCHSLTKNYCSKNKGNGNKLK